LTGIEQNADPMKQREVTDKDNIKWTCVQAYAGLEGQVSEKVAELSENHKGEVPVVCTPTGGAQTVRLNLKDNWEEQLSDEDLVAAIAKEQ
jgi:predicted transcriptional regulator